MKELDVAVLTALQERVENSPGRDSKLGFDILAALFGDGRNFTGDPHDGGYDPNRGEITSSVDAVLALCETLLPTHMVEMGRYFGDDEAPEGCKARVTTYCMGDGPRWESDDRGEGATLALAVLASLIKALIANAPPA